MNVDKHPLLALAAVTVYFSAIGVAIAAAAAVAVPLAATGYLMERRRR